MFVVIDTHVKLIIFLHHAGQLSDLPSLHLFGLGRGRGALENDTQKLLRSVVVVECGNDVASCTGELEAWPDRLKLFIYALHRDFRRRGIAQCNPNRSIVKDTPRCLWCVVKKGMFSTGFERGQGCRCAHNVGVGEARIQAFDQTLGISVCCKQQRMNVFRTVGKSTSLT